MNTCENCGRRIGRFCPVCRPEAFVRALELDRIIRLNERARCGSRPPRPLRPQSVTMETARGMVERAWQS